MRRCEKCGSSVIVAYQSMLKRQCEDCKHEMPWKKKEGQAPLLGNNRQRTQAEDS